MSIIIRGETGWREEGCTGGPLRGSRMNEQIERWRTVRTDDWRRHPGVRRTVSINSPLLLFLFIMCLGNAGSSHPFPSFSFFYCFLLISFPLSYCILLPILICWPFGCSFSFFSGIISLLEKNNTYTFFVQHFRKTKNEPKVLQKRQHLPHSGGTQGFKALRQTSRGSNEFWNDLDASGVMTTQVHMVLEVFGRNRAAASGQVREGGCSERCSGPTVNSGRTQVLPVSEQLEFWPINAAAEAHIESRANLLMEF